MKITNDSHVDHGITKQQLDFIQDKFAERTEFFIETITLPKHLGTAPCGLYGPVVGDAPVSDDEVYWDLRGGREWETRLVDRPLRPTRQVTVIAGQHNGEFILYTAFGGPAAPKEIDDPTIATAEERLKSEEFWAQHALSAWELPRFHHFVLQHAHPSSHATVAVIPIGQEEVAVGVAFCSAKDQFSRARGRQIAEGRALSAARTRPLEDFSGGATIHSSAVAKVAVSQLRKWCGDTKLGRVGEAAVGAYDVCELLGVTFPQGSKK